MDWYLIRLFFLPIYSTSSHSIVVFFSVNLLSLMRHFQQVLYPARPVENVALTAKDLQENNTTIEWDDGGEIGIKNK